MEAVGQLTGGIAHDFNNLLTGISGAMEMLDLRLSQGRVDDLARYIGVAQTATARAAAHTHRLLAFSRRKPHAPPPINIARLTGATEALVRRDRQNVGTGTSRTGCAVLGRSQVNQKKN